LRELRDGRETVIHTASLSLIVLGIWLLAAERDRRRPWAFLACVSAACWYAMTAVLAVMIGLPVVGGLTAGLAGWCAYKAWKRRPPRKRQPRRLAGRIRIRGHRLEVAPT
jgi:hypothetical protein